MLISYAVKVRRVDIGKMYRMHVWYINFHYFSSISLYDRKNVPMNTVEMKQRKTVQLIEHDEIYHKQYRDTVRICGKDTASADVLRVYEAISNQRANALIKQHNISEPYYPHEDDLWIDELTLRQLEERTFENRGKSTYARAVADCSPDPRRPSLLQRGYLRTRYIARPYDQFTEPDDDLPTIYYDNQGYFIVVQNRNGFYVGDDGSLQCARSQGFPMVARQYRVEVEVIRAALAKCAWREPPPPLKRWGPVVQQRSVAGTAQETTNSYDAQSDATTRNDSQASDNARRGTIPTGSPKVIASFASEHNIDFPTLSTEFSENRMRIEEPVDLIKQPVKPVPLAQRTIDHGTLRVAPWTPETLLGLSAHNLAIPARPADDDEAALRQWLIDWFEPAMWLIDKTKDVDPRRAWEKIQRHICGMTNGPTWHAQKRSHHSPITLRHVVGYNKPTRQFTGHNWRSVEVALDREQWWPEQTTPYAGPPLELEYEAGYEGASPPAPAIEAEVVVVPDGHIEAITEVEEAPGQATESDGGQREEPTTDAVVAPVPRQRRVGMTAEAAMKLTDEIRGKYPGIVTGYREVAPDRWVVKVHLDERRRFNLDLVGWYCPTPEIEAHIEEALRYAASLECGGDDPLPQVESEEHDDEQGTHRADHSPGVLQAAMGSS